MKISFNEVLFEKYILVKEILHYVLYLVNLTI